MRKGTVMEKLCWNEALKVNVPQIDDQHLCFVNLINLIIENIDHEQAVLESLCDELIAFARFHFLSEENLMVMNKYPDYDDHRKEHERILRKLNENIVGVHLEKENISELIEFLFTWFKEHSNVEDKALGKFLN